MSNGGGFNTAFIAAMAQLPDEVRAVLTGPPPNDLDELDADPNWAAAFRTWAQFSPSSAPALGYLNSFISWATPNWGVSGGGISQDVTLGALREVLAAYFDGAPHADAGVLAAVAEARGSAGEEDTVVTQLAQLLVDAVGRAYNDIGTRFVEEMLGTEQMQGRATAIQQGDEWLERRLAEARTENAAVLNAMADREASRLTIYQWAAPMILVGDEHAVADLGGPVHEGQIARKGSGWVVDDPGGWLEWIVFELAEAGVPGEVRVGDTAKYDDFDDTWAARVNPENARVLGDLPDRARVQVQVFRVTGDLIVCIGAGHDVSSFGPVRKSLWLAKRRATFGVGEWMISDPGDDEYTEAVQAATSATGSKKPVVVGDPSKYAVHTG